MRVPFALFWCVALVSNVAAGAQATAVGWILGGPSLPPIVLTVFQVSVVVGTLLGVVVGSRVVGRLGLRRTLVLSATIEAVACCAVAVAALGIDEAATQGQAFLLAALAVGAPFGGGIGGPAWMALVAQWPGSRDSTSQLLRDGIQFQLGRFVGPLIGSALIVDLDRAASWLAAANAATFVCVALVCVVMADPVRDAAVRGRGDWRDTISAALRSRTVWAIALLAAGADAARVFLPRLLREAGEDASVYGAALAALAGAAAIAAGVASRVRVSTSRLGAIGAASVCLGLASWAIAPTVGTGAWLAGAVLIGAGAATSIPSMTAAAMAGAREGGASSAAASVMVVRTIAGAGGSVVLGAVLPLLGGLVLLVGAGGAGVAAVLAGARPRAVAAPTADAASSERSDPESAP